MKIPFNIPYLCGKEESYIREALLSRRHCGNHSFAERCIALMQERWDFQSIFLVPSGTAALEMGLLLADIKAGDEVILPSYTFSSTANAIVLRDAKPVFCEIDPATMNMDIAHMESLISEKTRLLLPIDYAGIPAEHDRIQQIASRHGLLVMDDAAQSLGSYYQGKPCGAWGDLAAFSFHETKNITCGEGGALLVNRPDWIQRATFLQEKGTDRSLVLSGVKSKYGWVDKGSSYLLSDLLAAMLLAQLESAEYIMRQRKKVTAAYQELYAPYAKQGCLCIARPPAGSSLNGHAFFVIFDKTDNRELFLAKLREKQVYAYIGYVPLHSSKMGQKLGYKAEDLPITEDLAKRVVRLPMYADLPEQGMQYCLESMEEVLQKIYSS